MPVKDKTEDGIGHRLGRRQFLKLAGATAMGTAMGGVALRLGLLRGSEAAASTDDPLTKHQWAMVFDLRRCDGCKRCTKACRKMHYLPKDQEWIKVYEAESAGGQKYFLPRPCMQCENPPCVKVCPVQATYQVPDGVTLVDQNVCIGCRMCMAACPYEARYFNWDDPPEVPSTVPEPRPEWPVPQQKGTVGKCVFCVHDIRYGRLPACVTACTMEAIYLGDFNTDLATTGKKTVKLSELIKDNDAFRLKEELNTRPRVYYIAGHGQDLKY